MDTITGFLTVQADAASAFLDGVTTEDLARAAVVAAVAFLYVAGPVLLAPAVTLTLLAAVGYGFYAAPIVAPYVVLGLVLAYGRYAKWVFGEWEKEFAGHRLTRCTEGSASNKQMPDIKTVEDNKAKILHKAMFHKNFDNDELLHSVEELKRTRQDNKVFRDRAKRFGTLTASSLILQKLQQSGSDIRVTRLLDLHQAMSSGSLCSEKAEELDMDHVFVNFPDFLWGYTFIGPFSYILWVRRTLVLRFRMRLQKWGLINPIAKCDYEALAATLCLEQTQAIHYYGRTKPGSERGNVAGFFFADFPWVDNNCEFQIANLFAVDVDLHMKRWVKGRLDDQILNAKETVTLLWYNTVAAQHVKLHAMANWGLNLDNSLDDVNPFLRQNSVVTVMYNYFGYTTFSRFIKIWVDQGLMSEGWATPHKPLIKSFNHGIKDNVWSHPLIEDLAKHSRFVKFVIQTRAIFLAEFQKHKHLFPGVNGEAMFVGTVLHSLDHTMMDWNLKDALFLDTSDDRFGKMAEIGRVIKAGFVSDVDGLYFHKRFKGSGHPFYDAVYKKAAKIDKELADHMDTCIIK